MKAKVLLGFFTVLQKDSVNGSVSGFNKGATEVLAGFQSLGVGSLGYRESYRAFGPYG